MAMVEEGTDPQWRENAEAFLAQYCREHEEVFCDDLWEAGLEVPREARALGPLIMALVKQGTLVKLRARPSVHSRMALKTVWRSTVYRKAG